MTYSAIFKDHLAHPRNVGELHHPSLVAEETNPVCGDRIRISLTIDNNRISAAKYLAYGCPPTLVCGSVLTELIREKKISEASELTKAELLSAVGGLPSRKHHAAALAIETLHSALKNHPQIKPITPTGAGAGAAGGSRNRTKGDNINGYE